MVKTCSQCGLEKDTSEFNKRTASKDGFAALCKACKAAYNKERYYTNHELFLEQKRKWREDNREQHRAYSKRYAQEHPKEHNEASRKWNEKNPEKRRAITQRYRDRNPEKYRGYWTERRARKRAVYTSPNLTEELALCFILMPRCVQCGSSDNLQVDHIIPLAWGGPTMLNNFQTLCLKHNAAKGAHRATDYRSQSVKDKVVEYGLDGLLVVC
jgi:5-methylcytosine-specific restriction endonuclease McrA